MLKKKIKYSKGGIIRNTSLEGETIEMKIERILNNKEPIKDGAPLIYTERKDGIQAGYNIRTDRFEVAVEAMDKVTKSAIAKRDPKVIDMPREDVAKGESIQATNDSKE